MNARDIEIFRSVMVAGTASKTAALLGISQSAVSQSLRKLEASAGLCLFQRVRGRLVPTQEAKILLVDVERHFVGLEAIAHRISSLRSNGLNRLTVSAYPALGLNFLPKVVAAFLDQFPQTQISLQVMSSKDVHHHVSTGQADFGLMADEMPVVGLEHSRFFQAPGVVVMRAGDPLSRKRMIAMDDLDGRNFIVLNAEDSSRKYLDGLLHAQGVSPNRVVETPYSQTVCELTLQGAGIGIANPITALDFIDRGLVMKRLSVDVEFRGILLFRTDRLFSESTKRFLKFTRIQLQQDQQDIRKIIDS